MAEVILTDEDGNETSVVEVPDELFVMSVTEAVQLWNFLSKEFINPEFYPAVHSMIRRLVKFVDENV